MKRLLFLALLACACDREIVADRYYLRDAESIEIRSVSCTYTSFCYDCGIGWDGQYSCGYRLSLSCDGHQPARVRVRPYVASYESGKTARQEDVAVLSLEGSCG